MLYCSCRHQGICHLASRLICVLSCVYCEVQVQFHEQITCVSFGHRKMSRHFFVLFFSPTLFFWGGGGDMGGRGSGRGMMGGWRGSTHRPEVSEYR